MTEMSKKEIRDFLMEGTFTGKLATVKKDGSSHIVPIWFVLDDSDSDNINNIVFTTTVHQLKQRTFNITIG